jgi:hypothetical protein
MGPGSFDLFFSGNQWGQVHLIYFLEIWHPNKSNEPDPIDFI